MSYSTDVATFTQILGPFYEYVADLSPAGAEAQANQVEDKDQDSGVEETPSKYEGRPNLKELLGQYDDDESPGKAESFHAGLSLAAYDKSTIFLLKHRGCRTRARTIR